MKEVSKGQSALMALAGWFGQYMAMTEAQALIVSVWVAMTWVSERLTTAPYLAITANAPGCGKSTLLELLKMVCRNGKTTIGATPAALFALIEQYDQKLTLLLDENEKEGNKLTSQLLNAGYRKGQTIPRRAGEKVIEYAVYCPKAFALIGDLVNAALRDRTINVDLRLGKPAKRLRPADAELEATLLVDMLKQGFAAGQALDLDAAPAHLSGRDLEVWESIFAVATALKLDAATMGKLTDECMRLIGAKSAKPRSADATVTNREDANVRKFGEWALRDLASVFKEGEKAVFSVEAVNRMRALRGPWASYEGVGLSPDSLASLVKRFLPDYPTAVQTGTGRKVVKDGVQVSGRIVGKGYSAAAVRAAVAALAAE